MRNLVTDVPGLRVGNAEDPRLLSGVTVVVPDEPAVAAVHVMGGAPGTRETDLLDPDKTVERIDALVLAGGSAFGLDAAAGVMGRLAAAGRGFRVGPVRVPIVPAAILFDLLNGGNKDWGGDKDWGGVNDRGGRDPGGEPPYRRLGAEAFDAASDRFALGSAGAGMGATTANLRGGLGSASATVGGGITVGAVVAVNAVGRATIGDGPHFWAAPFEVGTEFGGLGLPSPFPAGAAGLHHKLSPRRLESTTIAVVATDARLTKAEAKRVAVMAHDGFARALWPAHTPFDGDLVFALSTGRVPLPDPAMALIEIGAAAAACVCRAIARGVYEASSAAGVGPVPAWRDRFG